MFLHCNITREMWSLVFCLFVSQGMSNLTVDIWQREIIVKYQIWKAILLCLLWFIWREKYVFRGERVPFDEAENFIYEYFMSQT